MIVDPVYQPVVDVASSCNRTVARMVLRWMPAGGYEADARFLGFNFSAVSFSLF